MKTISIYTDGACSGNPGKGGYGAIIAYKGVEKELSGGYELTTNNRMEILGVIKALDALKEPCAGIIYSDSRYVVDAVEKGWAARWRENGWKRNKKDAALNPDLWERLLCLLSAHDMRFEWVKGHADNASNERCDMLARTAIETGPWLIDSGYVI